MSEQMALPFPEWRDIPGYEGRYQVSNTGLVRSLTNVRLRGKTIGSVNPRGYQQVILSLEGAIKTLRVHRLVMLAFIGQCPPGMQVNHKNGIRHDNRLENLEYVTPSQNVRHAHDVLKIRKNHGEQVYCAKLTDDSVREIRRLSATGTSQLELSRRYGVAPRTIVGIIKRQGWKHVN